MSWDPAGSVATFGYDRITFDTPPDFFSGSYLSEVGEHMLNLGGMLSIFILAGGFLLFLLSEWSDFFGIQEHGIDVKAKAIANIPALEHDLWPTRPSKWTHEREQCSFCHPTPRFPVRTVAGAARAGVRPTRGRPRPQRRMRHHVTRGQAMRS